MKKICLILFFVVLARSGFGQVAVVDSGTFILHKWEQKIGQEKYAANKKDNIISYRVDFQYTDRGSPVSLKSVIQVTAALEPVSFVNKGGTSRFSRIDDSVMIQNKTAFIRVDLKSFSQAVKENSFTIAGYSPATAQMLLIQYWKKHSQPQTINMLPSGSVQINQDGKDTFSYNNTGLVLERYVIKGLIWGNELLWTDSKGQLYCLITNDAEGDKQEMMLAAYELLLPDFIDKAAVYGMRLFVNAAKPSFQKHDVIAITGGTLVDVVNGITIPNATVVIEKGLIKKSGDAVSVTIPSNAYVIDAKGKTILPGLWDMHSHFEQAEWGPAYLAAGVTTVRDCGNEFGYINTIQKAIDDGQGIGPHILKAGLIDGSGAYTLGIITADTKKEAIAAVDRYKENGFVQIKIYSSVKPEIVKAICAEAHRVGLTVTGHIPEGMTLMQGVDSGMNMVNHVEYAFGIMKYDTADYSLDMNDSVSIAALRFIKSHHVVIDPTLGVYEMSFRSLSDSITIIEPAFKTLPEPLKALFLNTGTSDTNTIKVGKTLMKGFEQLVYTMYHDSITIVAGTDMMFPGYSLDRELELYVESGLTPMQAIQTATITPARVMRIADRSGSIEAGKQADLIIVDGDPLQNIRGIRNVTAVIKDGNIYDPVQLHKIAGFQ